MRQITADNLMTLTCARPGRQLRLARVDGGKRLQGRLHAMGLTPGAPLAVVSASGGPVLLDVMGSRLMIGRGMAASLWVREA